MKKILVVEDSTEIGNAISDLIGNSQSIIQMDQDLYLGRVQEDDIGLALIEIKDPLNRKYDIIQTLLDLNRDVRILLVIDPDLLDYARPLLTDNIFDYLLKPLDTKELKRKINLPFTADSEIESTGLLWKIATEMAHRIKNPLTTIKTFTSLLKERFDDPEFRDTFYGICLKEVGRIDETIERLASYSSIGKPMPALVDLGSIIKDTINKVMYHYSCKDIKVLTDLQEDIPPVFADMIQIRLVLENLFSFILSDIKENGEVKIRCLRSALRGGEGIEVEIFYPFRREGLDDKDLFVVDLFLSREIIRHQGGELNARTINGDVKIISIILPCPINIESIMKLVFDRNEDFTDNKISPLVMNYYDRRKSHLPIHFSERRVKERRRGQMSLCFPEKRQILGVFTHL